MKTFLGLFSFIFVLLINMPTHAMESEPISDQAFLHKITLEKWLDKPKYAPSILRILKLFNNSKAQLLSNDRVWVNHAPQEIIDGLMTGRIKIPLQPEADGTYQHIPNMPFLAKWIIPGNNCVISIGDLHSNFAGLKEILNNMHSLKLFKSDGSMQLKNNVKLIFLGDYMDRGYYPMETFITAALLYLKNPGQVLLLRGNHENIAINLISYGLKLEIDELTHASEEITSKIIEELSKSYEFLPVGAFIGYQDSLPTKFIFHVHGCVDIRINCKDLLEFDAINLSQNGGLKLWKFGRENIMPPEELSRFYKDIIPNFDNLMKDFLEALTNPDPTAGFLWNDISCGQPYFLNKSTRGDCVINMDICMIKKYLENYNSDKTNVCGLVRGHQHNLAKETYKNIQKDLASLSYKNLSTEGTSGLIDDDEIIDQNVYRKMTPACVINIRTEHATACILQHSTFPLNFDNDFWVATLISCSIIENQEVQILYPPTFLSLRYTRPTRQYSLQTVYDTGLLQE
ncbi:MAG: metallophosphoesterase [Candidatus Babeliales bacterium]|jgi:hypothetical protein|nr:MAG: Serine/threonine-protein phosphatase [candidate division TM6 bacterium GW2011_GWF2_36_6]